MPEVCWFLGIVIHLLRLHLEMPLQHLVLKEPSIHRSFSVLNQIFLL